MTRISEAMPLSPMSNNTNCPHGAPGHAPITPVVSVRSVNGETGDVVLKKLKIGEKEYDGTNHVQIFAGDLGLEKALTYEKAVSSHAKAEEIMTSASAGTVVYCSQNDYYYMSVGEGEYKTFISGIAAERFAEITATANKIVLAVDTDTFELTARLYDINGNVIFESEPVLLPSGMNDAIVGGSFDFEKQEIIFELKNSKEIRVPILGLIENIQPKITESNKLPFRFVEDLPEFKSQIFTELNAEIENRTAAVANEAVVRHTADELEAETRSAADAKLQEALNIESNARETADTTLTYNLEVEVDERKYAFRLLKDAITDEAQARVLVEEALREESIIRENADKELNTLLSVEVASREADTNTLRNEILAESTARTMAVNDLTANLQSEVEARIQRDAELTDMAEAEAAAREYADDMLQDAIDDEVEARAAAVTTEIANRVAEDTAIRNALKIEIAERQLADETLQLNIEEEAESRKEADRILQENLNSEASTREANDLALQTELQENIDAETSARITADNDLQEQILDIPVYSIVKDPVPDTYFAVYHLTKQVRDGEIVNIGDPITINKDYLVNSADLAVVTIPDVPYEGAQVGDKYIDFVINTKENPSGSTQSHIYLPVNDLVDVYTAGAGIKIVNNQISIANDTLNEIGQLRVDLGNETTERENVDAGLRNDLNALGRNLDIHNSRVDNPHNVTKDQIGLGNVDNTADLDKPISIAVKVALDKEVTLREEADAALTEKINNDLAVEREQRNALLDIERRERVNAISDERTAREEADADLSLNIELLNSSLKNEIAVREDEIQNLQDQITVINSKKVHSAVLLECNGIDNVYAITHDLGTFDVIVQVYDLADYSTVLVDSVRTNSNVVTLTFAEVPDATKRYKVLCYGISDVLISIDANGGAGTMAAFYTTKNIPCTLPVCSFTAPEGMVFDKWAIKSADSDIKVEANRPYVFNIDTTIYATWKFREMEPNIYYGAVENVPPTNVNELTGTYIDIVNNNEAVLSITVGADDYKSEVFAVPKASGINIIKIECYALSAWQNVTSEFLTSEANNTTFYYREQISNDVTTDYRITFNFTEV